MMMAIKNTTFINLSPNMASAAVYVPVVGFVAAVVLLIIEKNSTVRWNAVQSLLLGLTVVAVDAALAMTLILALAVPLVNVAALVISLVLAVKSYQGETVRLPVLGAWTDKIIKKG
ncbi:MAG: hypothetical protein UX99_C0032G0011 [Candidatus Amesbacteria bacterium GW2011_GWB1_47_26]|uniref:Chloroplast import component protein (Tic20) n=1 Tax=Candidatus Amesbacteria bacterium GW2011_GWC2_45_19 TaxID=1618366 RepID=A0A0G1M3K2_9BACT|nr:MAG: hypothetical protein UX05_C0006G0009 [Candidatus Amesbacteria bacterium GW2011_GWC2_45_19]KKU37358.1 MAG: hypothetical protein UX52_C0028G0010 [Candidatus Amesbacteria bacterium GW2011_GWA1_46_35]KKU68277.1 MAG: hypothetical protein UX93_C0009G0051 [Microgenomates group bacterium GW2011_GWC1_47_20]KKU73311.1 MAG: hypothetical protein UX99_C0032G0011 [Candidatus Amesbacteria bacterium GW2011_GWB1_47_26]KKU79454.1 MAG: hypothetical protein UY06_C0022G0009 [Candidatus Amesbacteria bacteriu